MSDSENDLLPSNVFTFQNENTMISAKGPSVNSTNITNLSFRNNVMTSTMHMSRNFERQRYGELALDQRSMYYRRETSPVSKYGGSDMRPRNFNHSYYQGGMGSQRSMYNGSSHRSMYNGRSGSPISMRSMDSNASVSAVDIALAFKNVKFNKYDLRMIKEAYNKFMKRRVRKKIEKRRNLKVFLKGYRRKSGYDSGEQGSDSSISSDDCKSTSSALYKNNMSSCRSTRTDITDFRRSIRESNMYKDCTENIKHNSFKNMFSVQSSNTKDGFKTLNALQNGPVRTQSEFKAPNPVKNRHAFTQKERFQSGYLLPSQRFNKSVASATILESDPRSQARQNIRNVRTPKKNEVHSKGKTNHELDSDQEKIFSEVTVKEKSPPNLESQCNKITEQGKRSLEIEDNTGSDRKKPKLSSPKKKLNKDNNLLQESNCKSTNKKHIDKNSKSNEGNHAKENVGNEKQIDFEFIKPQFPVRKSGPAKPKEMLISKSAPPLVDAILPPPRKPQVDMNAALPKTTENLPTTEEQPDSTQHSTSDISMRPSFIKRKLFTQKMDVTEKKNLNSDATNSPQTSVYSDIHREKHKARKLVTNQSCLSRDIAQEDNNLLDLIHKIVPADRMNATNVTNKTSISTTSASISSKNPVYDDDKWDVTSIISTCNNDDVSDTYTDEEIFGVDGNKKRKKENNKKTDRVNKLNDDVEKDNENEANGDIKGKVNKKEVSKKLSNDCKIVVEKLSTNKLVSKPTVTAIIHKAVVPNEENVSDNNKKTVYNCVKSFWDTDFESDIEAPAPKRPIIIPSDAKENQNISVFMEAHKIALKNKSHNISLASVSESIKSKTMPTNNLGMLKKLNTSRNITIRAIYSPKPNELKPAEKTMIKHSQLVEELFKTPETVQNNKSKKRKTKPQTENDSGKKIKEVKETELKKKEAKKTQLKKTEVKKANQKTNNEIIILDQDSEITQSAPKGTKSLKANNNKKPPANKSTTGRAVRTPQKRACCDETMNSDHDKSTKSSATKSKQKVGNSSKKTKVDDKVDSNAVKRKAAEKTKNSSKQKLDKKPSTKLNESIIEKRQPKKPAVKNNKKEVIQQQDEVPVMNRTLRPRKITLTSSINSSTENITLQMRSLRTRKVDLSNSLRNSSLDETLKIKPLSNDAMRKTAAKSSRAEVLNKKPRSVKS